MLETGALIIENYDRLKIDRSSYVDVWIDIADDVLGMRHFDLRESTRGQIRHQEIYDQTGLNSGMLLASTLHGIVTNPGARFHFSWVPEPIRDIGFNNDYLRHVDEVLDALYKSDRHGFPVAATEWWIDYVFFGTAGMFTADKPGLGPVDSARPLGELVIDESEADLVDTVYRLSNPTARQFIQKYGLDAHKPTTAIYESEPTREIPVIHLVHPRSDLNPGSDALRDRRAMRSVHVVVSDKTIIRESGMASDPWQVARYLKESGEKYGKSPGWFSLSDCQSASEMARNNIISGQKAVDPALLIPDQGVLTQLDSTPGGVTVYRAGSLDRDAIRQMPAGDLSRASIESLQNTREQIKERYHGNLLSLFDAAVPTATQALEMETKAARILVSTIARAATEFAAKSLRRKFDVAQRAGMFDDPPDTLDGVPIEIRYLSPIMKAQAQMETRSILNMYQAANLMLPAHPDIMDNYDGDFYAREIAQNEGANLAGLVPVDVRDEIRRIRAEQEQAQAKMDVISQGSEAIGKLGPIIQAAQNSENQTLQ